MLKHQLMLCLKGQHGGRPLMLLNRHTSNPDSTSSSSCFPFLPTHLPSPASHSLEHLQHHLWSSYYTSTSSRPKFPPPHLLRFPSLTSFPPHPLPLAPYQTFSPLLSLKMKTNYMHFNWFYVKFWHQNILPEIQPMIKSQPLVGVKLACNPVFTKLSQCELSFQVFFPFNDDDEYDKE